MKEQHSINRKKEPWILAGYALFSKQGHSALKVDVMAKLVNKSRSSFYHHFADLDIFRNDLLNYHIERSKIIAEREKTCTNVIPELINVLVEFKQDLLFNRQLRVDRANPEFSDCLKTSNEIVAGAINEIWAEALGLSQNSNLAEMVLALSIENFYLQITEHTLNYTWIEQYIRQLQGMVKAFDKVQS